MATLNQIVYDIKNIAYSGLIPDDAKISDRQIAFWVNTTRAKFLKQRATKGTIDSSYKQVIPNVIMEKIKTGPLSTDTELRSTQKIPVPIFENGVELLTSVTSSGYKMDLYSDDQPISFSRTTREASKHIRKGSIYSGNEPRWYYYDGYLYLMEKHYVNKVILEGIFEDPTEASMFLTTGGTLAFDWDSKYPIPEVLISDIVNTIIKEKIVPLRQLGPADNENNGRDDTVEK
jgi:hypothetical protein